MLHFAYGANMHRAVMRRHAPAAEPLGAASLPGRRFVITADGYASIVPAPGQVVHGVLWRIAPRDRVKLDAWENVAGGLYRAATIAVQSGKLRRPALVYIARPRPAGVPKPGYMEMVVAAARAWRMPERYIVALEEWLPKRPRAAGHRKIGDFL